MEAAGFKRELQTYPSDILKERAAEVSDFSVVEGLVRDMIAIMTETGGIGIAAPQVGESLRVIVVKTSGGPRALVNPEIIRTSQKTVRGLEGCLSCPGLTVKVERHKSVTVKAFDTKGNPVEIEAIGLLAVILQHEIDHLKGITIYDSLPIAQRKVYLNRRGLI